MTQKPTTPCLEWQGSVNVHGYGTIWIKGKNVLVHALVWRIANAGKPLRRYHMVVDHTCRNRRCIRLEHLEAVTHGTNTLRGTGFSAVNAKKTQCPKGHRYSKYTVQSLWKRRRHRRCLLCKRKEGRERMRRLFGHKPRVFKNGGTR